MKKLFLTFSIMACIVCFNACSTDVELYSDYKDIPVIYGLIDVSQDTNFIRINRAFSSSNDNPINALDVALIADSCNYPGKLDAKIVEYKTMYGNQFEPTGVVFELDTITVHDKDTGVFYAPNQKVYYTNATFKTNTGSNKYKYRLVINKDNDTITAETGVVGGADFKILTTQVNFTPESNNNTGRISFKPSENAVFYDVKMTFNYKEERGGDMVEKQVKWNFGAQSVDDISYDGGTYSVYYIDNSLFSLLQSAIGNDTVNVVRYFSDKPVDIMIAAGGEELYNYIQINAQAGGLSQSIPDFTNIKGGYGVFSSRINLEKSVRLSAYTQIALIAKPWGFRQEQP